MGLVSDGGWASTATYIVCVRYFCVHFFSICCCWWWLWWWWCIHVQAFDITFTWISHSMKKWSNETSFLLSAHLFCCCRCFIEGLDIRIHAPFITLFYSHSLTHSITHLLSPFLYPLCAVIDRYRFYFHRVRVKKTPPLPKKNNTITIKFITEYEDAWFCLLTFLGQRSIEALW